MPKVEISIKERLAVAAICTLGTSSLDDAYRLVNTKTQTDSATLHRMALRWFKNEKVKNLYNELLPKTETSAQQEDSAPLTRDYLISELRQALRNTKDPDKRAGIVMKLADLSNLKKGDVIETTDQRTYFLPWQSNCRTCALIKLYQDVKKRNANK